MDFIGRYWKFVAQVVATVAAGIVAALQGDDVVSSTEWVNVAILGVGALSVLAAPNVPGAKYTKFVISALSAVLALLASYIVGGITTTELLQLFIAAAGAVGVVAAKNDNTNW